MKNNSYQLLDTKTSDSQHHLMNQKTKVLRLTGTGLLLAAGLLSFAWFYWLAPVKHLYSHVWIHKHSTTRWWEEAQKTVDRIGVSHDVGIEIGRWGGKEWVVWIMKHIKPGQDIDSCQASHLASALADMTNQQLGYTADPWLAWWNTNQYKSQVEWIREGFAQKGVTLQHPLTTNNILTLLKLSRLATNSPLVTNTPRHLQSSLRFNAFRWLRDSGFSGFGDARTLAQSLDWKNISEEDREQITIALIDYAEWFGAHWNDPGKLPITTHSDYETEPAFMGRPFRWTLYFVIAALIFSGLWLVRHESS